MKEIKVDYKLDSVTRDDDETFWGWIDGECWQLGGLGDGQSNDGKKIVFVTDGDYKGEYFTVIPGSKL